MTTVPNNNQQLTILPALLEHFYEGVGGNQRGVYGSGGPGGGLGWMASWDGHI